VAFFVWPFNGDPFGASVFQSGPAAVRSAIGLTRRVQDKGGVKGSCLGMPKGISSLVEDPHKFNGDFRPPVELRELLC